MDKSNIEEWHREIKLLLNTHENLCQSVVQERPWASLEMINQKLERIEQINQQIIELLNDINV